VLIAQVEVYDVPVDFYLGYVVGRAAVYDVPAELARTVDVKVVMDNIITGRVCSIDNLQ